MKRQLLISVLLFTSAFLGAQVIHIPGDYATIQEGIDAAQFFGDTVLVAEGTYYETIDFNGKFITVASNFIMDGDTNHINNTIIDGSQPANPDYGSVVYFHSGEDTNSVICGFTITGGTGIYVPLLDMYGGGGIAIENYSGAKILHNHIEYNAIISNGSGSGGGIGAGDANNTNYVIIKNNRVCNNSVIAHENSEGGGIVIHCNAIIKDNVVCNNTVTSETKTAVGGGIRVIGYNTERYIECSENLIASNIVSSSSMEEYAGAGGLQVFRCYGKVSNNRIIHNIIEGSLGSIGGGIMNAYSTSALTFENNIISENHANFEETEGKGGGLYLVVANPLLINNIITNNYASLGGGLYNHLIYDIPTQLINNTIAYNQDGDDGGGIYLEDADMVVLNTILWNNDNYEGNEITMMGNSSIEVAYSDVNGGWPGEGIIDEDPVFIDEAFHIPVESPCKDMGIDQLTMLGILVIAPDHDFEGTPRPMEGGFDIGADEYPIGTGINEFAESYFNMNIFPNPTQRLVKFRYEVDDAQSVSLSIFNINGVEVFSKYFGYNIPGEYNQELDLSVLPPGMYLLRLHARAIVETSKIIIQK
ncbi:MAG: T9SS type A sorting domain-containing protein [Bacteroidales bacterium]|nr:T9SS type A sorting domain-containing protein [Bacteroidales bacterium]